MLMIDFGKAVISGDEPPKSLKLVGKRILYAIIIFVMPWIVGVLTYVIKAAGLDLGGDYNDCIGNVNEIKVGSQSLDYYDTLLKIEEESNKPVTPPGGSSGNPGGNSGSNSGSNSGNNSGNHGGSQSGGNLNSGTGFKSAAQNLITLIKGEVGKTDRTKYGAGAGDPWCGYFSTWALKNTKLTYDGKTTTVYDYIRNGQSVFDGAASGLWPSFKKNNNVRWEKSNYYGGHYTPKAGDVIWFWWPNEFCQKNNGKWNGTTQCADHVGIVEYFDGTYVHTIEGNSGGKVSANTSNLGGKYTLNSSNITAYGSWYD